jgi:hypothetical protein
VVFGRGDWEVEVRYFVVPGLALRRSEQEAGKAGVAHAGEASLVARADPWATRQRKAFAKGPWVFASAVLKTGMFGCVGVGGYREAKRAEWAFPRDRCLRQSRGVEQQRIRTHPDGFTVRFWVPLRQMASLPLRPVLCAPCFVIAKRTSPRLLWRMLEPDAAGCGALSVNTSCSVRVGARRGRHGLLVAQNGVEIVELGPRAACPHGCGRSA